MFQLARVARIGLVASMLLPLGCSATTNIGADGGGPAGDGGGPLADGALPGDGGANGSLSFTPSNVDLRGIDPTTLGDFVVSGDECSLNTDQNLAACGDGADQLGFKVVTQRDGSRVGVYVARSMTIQAGTALGPASWAR